MKRLGYETMRHLLVILERFGGPLGASLTALGASWGALGRVLGALRKLLGTSSAEKPFVFKNKGFASAGARFSKTRRLQDHLTVRP